MREEYEYTVNNLDENSEVNGMNDMNNMNSGYNGFSADGNSSKKNKKHLGAKIAASLMAMALVSTGSIGVYRQFAGTNTASTAVTETAEASTADTAKSIINKAKNVSIIKPEDSEGGTLTTEEVVDKVLPSVVGIE